MHTAAPRRHPSASASSIAAIALAAALLAPATTRADDKPREHSTSAQALLQRCAACHGANGNTTDALLYPNLAGQSAAYIELQLSNFKSGERPHAQMRAVAAELSSADMRTLAGYYAAQPARAQRSTDPALEKQGRQIFEHGSAGGAPACAGCHGPQGHGQSPFPRVASQPPGYTLEQLKVYRDAPKFNNPLATAMKAVAIKLSDADMRAVSAYLATVR